MNCHEVRDLLMLSAAGMLDAPEQRLVMDHSRECAECAEELAMYASITYQISGTPMPQPSPLLVETTQRMMAEEADRRQGSRLALAAGVLASGMSLVTWEVGRMVTAGWIWNVWCLAGAIAASAAVAGLVARRRFSGPAERSL